MITELYLDAAAPPPRWICPSHIKVWRFRDASGARDPLVVRDTSFDAVEFDAPRADVSPMWTAALKNTSLRAYVTWRRAAPESLLCSLTLSSATLQLYEAPTARVVREGFVIAEGDGGYVTQVVEQGYVDYTGVRAARYEIETSVSHYGHAITTTIPLTDRTHVDALILALTRVRARMPEPSVLADRLDWTHQDGVRVEQGYERTTQASDGQGRHR